MRAHDTGVVLLLAVLAALTTLSAALTVNVPPSAEQCFFENIDQAQKVLGSFEVVSGGYLDIDVKVWGPDGKIVYEENALTDGSFQFVAQEKGIYKVCFSNSMSTVTAKQVSFSLYAGSMLAAHGVAKKEHFTPLESAVMLLGEGLRAVQAEQRYLSRREEVCRKTVDSTKNRVTVSSSILALLLIALGIFQVMFVKRLIEKKGKK